MESTTATPNEQTPVGTEYAAVLATCSESSGRLQPLRYGYFRVFLDDTGEIFLSATPVDDTVEAISVKLNLDMTLREAIDAIGPDGTSMLEWISGPMG